MAYRTGAYPRSQRDGRANAEKFEPVVGRCVGGDRFGALSHHDSWALGHLLTSIPRDREIVDRLDERHVAARELPSLQCRAPGVLITAPLSVREHGFSLHAATRAGAEDDKGREALLKYILRPPVASVRVVAAPDGLVRVAVRYAPAKIAKTQGSNPRLCGAPSRIRDATFTTARAPCPED